MVVFTSALYHAIGRHQPSTSPQTDIDADIV